MISRTLRLVGVTPKRSQRNAGLRVQRRVDPATRRAVCQLVTGFARRVCASH